MNIPSGVINAVRAVRQVAGREGSDALNGFMGTPNYKPQGEGSIYSIASTIPNMPDVPSVHGIQQGAEALRGAEHMMPVAAGYIGSIAARGMQESRPALSIARTIPTNLLRLSEDFDTAMGDVLQNRKSMSKLPVLAVPDGKGMYNLLDGNHRLADGMLKGLRDIEIITDEAAYRKLSELEDQYINQGKPRFIRNATGKFAGSKPKN